ncbi:MAG: hypothetical protein ACI4D8_03865 [Wujia sp.]
MKKKLSKVVSSLLAGIFAVGSIGITSLTSLADNAPYIIDGSAGNVIDASYVLSDPTEVTFTVSGVEGKTATLGLADAAWSYQDWESSVDITGDGTYTITSKSAEEANAEINDGVVVFVVDIKVNDDETALDINSAGVTISDVQVNGEAVNFVYGDIEEKGNVRIEIYNEYGPTSVNAEEPISWGDAAAAEAKTYIADASAGNALNASYVLTDPTEISFDVTGIEGKTATLGLADAAWSYQDWESTVDITGDGTYTITSKTAEAAGAEINDGVVVFVVDIKVNDDETPIDINSAGVTISNVKVNGEAVSFIYGDIEEKGNIRIEIYNEYGPTNADPTVWDGGAAVEEPDDTASTVAEFDPNGTYNAYLGLQTPNWTYRDAWNSQNGIGSDYFGDFIFGNETGEKYGKVTDAVVAGNGRYTVSVTDFGSIIADDFTTAGQDYFNLLYISTDIPLSDAITISDVTLTIDGNEVQTTAAAILDPDETEYVKILIQNIWNDECKEIAYYPAPTSSVEMSFTISGFSYDKADDATDDDTSVDEATPTTADDTKDDKKDNKLIIIIIVVVVVIIVAVVAVVLGKKKKK